MTEQEKDSKATEIFNAVIGDDRVQEAWTDARFEFAERLDANADSEELDTADEADINSIKAVMQKVAEEKGFELTEELIEIGAFSEFWDAVFM